MSKAKNGDANRSICIVPVFYIIALIFCSQFTACQKQNCLEDTVTFNVIDTPEGKEKGEITIEDVDANVFQFEWDTGSTRRQIVGLSAGEYCVTITEREGTCESIFCETVKAFVPEGSLNVNDGEFKILFIGNSHTFYNDLPKTVENLLAKDDPNVSIRVESETVGGFTLQDHVMSGRAENFIYKTNWDYVVLQENAGLAAFTQEEAEIEIYPFARQLAEMIQDNNRQTEIILYMTHAYKNGSERCVQNPNVCTYKKMQNEIRRNYIFISELFNSKIAPAGMMWRLLLDKEMIPLHNQDNIHPSEIGSQVSAATLYSTIRRKRLEAEDLSGDFFSKSEAESIVRIINASLFDKDPDWREY